VQAQARSERVAAGKEELRRHGRCRRRRNFELAVIFR
jgi:hypothetical protein